MSAVCKCSTTDCVYLDYSGAMFDLAMDGDTATGTVNQLFGKDGLDSFLPVPPFD